MTTTTVTSEQLAQLKTALENAVSGKAGVQSASYPAPKVKPVNSLGVLEPDTNDAVNNTYIVIDQHRLRPQWSAFTGMAITPYLPRPPTFRRCG